jgi:hypothetical protein
MKNAKWYYEISLKDKVALQYTHLPEFYGNMGSVHDMSDDTLADLSFAVADRGFVTHKAAIAMGIKVTSMEKARNASRELVLEEIRMQRDHLLTITDIAATVDRWNTMDVVQQYKVTEYRQSLRDLPKQQDIFNLKWPAIPKELSFIRNYQWPADVPMSEELRATIEATPEVISKEQAQTEQWARIVAIRDAKISGGVKVQGMWFHTDTTSLIQYLALLAAGDAIPKNIRWKTMDGSFIDVTPNLVRAVYSSAIISNNAIFQHAETLRAELMLAKDPAAFDIKARWPVVYADTVKA